MYRVICTTSSIILTLSQPCMYIIHYKPKHQAPSTWTSDISIDELSITDTRALQQVHVDGKEIQQDDDDDDDDNDDADREILKSSW